ncbi:MAG: BON domain-containing protein [Gammaproteobacteria bacterium]
MSAINLSVQTDDGEVTLVGSVKNAEQAARAVEIAGNVEGVTGVEDKMVRVKALGMPATPHQSTTVDAPLVEKARPEGTRSE